MEVINRKEKGAVVVQVRGRLDAVSSPELEKEIEKLIAGGENHLIVDLGESDYISSAGLRIILASAKKAKGKGGSLSVASLQSMVKEVFEVSGFNTIIPIYGSVDEALKKA